MLIFNPTTDVIVAKHDGAIYSFKPGEKRDVFNSYAANHILRRWGKFGLVDITFDEKIQKKFGDPESYTHEQTLKGILAWIGSMEERQKHFEMYDQECGQKQSVERLAFTRKAEDLKKKLGEAYDMHAELSKIGEKELKKARKERLQAQLDELNAELSSVEKGNKSNGRESGKHTGSSQDRTA